MNVLGASINCISIGFAIGFLARTGPSAGTDFLQLGGLLAFVAVVLILFEFSNLEPVATDRARPLPSVSTRAVAEGMYPR